MYVDYGDVKMVNNDKKFYLVKDIEDKLVAIFVNEEDCFDFIRGKMQYEYIELVI